MASSTSSLPATSKGIARPNTDRLMLELTGYDEWDFIDGYAQGLEVSESGSSEWTLTQATDQGQYPFSRSSSGTDSVGNGLDDTEHTINRRHFGRVAQAPVSSEVEAHDSVPTLLLMPRRKVLESRSASPSSGEDEHGGKNNRRWSKLWLRLSRLPSERIKQAGKSGGDITETASMGKRIPTAGLNTSRWKSILRTGHQHTPSLPEFGFLHKLEPFSTQRMGHTRSHSERPPIPKRPADEKTWDFLDTMPPSPSFRRRPIYSVPRLSSVPSLPLPRSTSSYPDSSVPHLPLSSQLSSKPSHGWQTSQEVAPVRSSVTTKGPSRESSAHYLPQERALSLRSRGRESARSPGSLRPSASIKRGIDAPFPISRSSSLGRKSGVGSYF
ncbi:hypothetical protein IW261DRAFT_1485367 [Armillaria novae-zelandiae]|uniref:Uncharacterized protein n=1 Tax=Armillaria novae-zelandiae TaxID=153914 RepID=A0AA39P4V4_9AGAR|nr:hypothetical protein IW261DRAFT_1485367 [Armillaria novae-zelandiae]